MIDCTTIMKWMNWIFDVMESEWQKNRQVFSLGFLMPVCPSGQLALYCFKCEKNFSKYNKSLTEPSAMYHEVVQVT